MAEEELKKYEYSLEKDYFELVKDTRNLERNLRKITPQQEKFSLNEADIIICSVSQMKEQPAYEDLLSEVRRVQKAIAARYYDTNLMRPGGQQIPLQQAQAPMQAQQPQEAEAPSQQEAPQQPEVPEAQQAIQEQEAPAETPAPVQAPKASAPKEEKTEEEKKERAEAKIRYGRDSEKKKSKVPDNIMEALKKAKAEKASKKK